MGLRFGPAMLENADGSVWCILRLTNGRPTEAGPVRGHAARPVRLRRWFAAIRANSPAAQTGRSVAAAILASRRPLR